MAKIVRRIGDALGGLPQLCDQLAHRADRFAADPALHAAGTITHERCGLWRPDNDDDALPTGGVQGPVTLHQPRYGSAPGGEGMGEHTRGTPGTPTRRGASLTR